MFIIRALSVETLKQRLYNPYYLFFISLNMSTIDAAIIKALVEHIGGDSSTIPDGTIGGDGDIMELWAHKTESAAADIQNGMNGYAYINIKGDPEDALGFHLLKINIFNTDYYGVFINNGTLAHVELTDKNNNTMSSPATKISDGIYSLDGFPNESVNFDESVVYETHLTTLVFGRNAFLIGVMIKYLFDLTKAQ